MSSITENQIESVISTAMKNLKDIIDVNTVLGKPISEVDGTVIVPVSKVTMGFLAGGGEYSSGEKDDLKKLAYPFAGGSGAYVQLSPVGFLVGSGKDIKPVSFNSPTAPYDKLVDAVADYLAKQKKKEQE